ncbi:MAG: DUF423 domain-containing protein [Bacteroidota bacterium]
MKFAFIAAFLLGLVGVVTGALGAHALEEVLDANQMDSYETAVRFQMYHSFLLLALGVLIKIFGQNQLLRLATFGTLIGTLLFSGSIYLLVLTPIKVGIVTPIGGMLLILSWAFLAVWAIRLAGK